MIFYMLKFHSHFIAKECLLGAFYCRMEPVFFQDLFYIDFIGHVILDQRI